MARWFVYILKCGDGTLYTGTATDVERRFREHRMGAGAKYTRGRKPVAIVYRQQFANRSRALRREAFIKQLDRMGKLELIRSAKGA